MESGHIGWMEKLESKTFRQKDDGAWFSRVCLFLNQGLLACSRNIKQKVETVEEKIPCQSNRCASGEKMDGDFPYQRWVKKYFIWHWSPNFGWEYEFCF